MRRIFEGDPYEEAVYIAEQQRKRYPPIGLFSAPIPVLTSVWD
jgi:hypothetical protein